MQDPHASDVSPTLSSALIEGADDLAKTRHCARDPQRVLHASIDAERLMRRAAAALARARIAV